MRTRTSTGKRRGRADGRRSPTSSDPVYRGRERSAAIPFPPPDPSDSRASPVPTPADRSIIPVDAALPTPSLDPIPRSPQLPVTVESSALSRPLHRRASTSPSRSLGVRSLFSRAAFGPIAKARSRVRRIEAFRQSDDRNGRGALAARTLR
ncbi:MAG TPA: hypothetical protein DCQ98_02465 [Planctomycetaceae bacterium]|nr:hypothetical protein [Planctomycetaceae bacterium]